LEGDFFAFLQSVIISLRIKREYSKKKVYLSRSVERGFFLGLFLLAQLGLKGLKSKESIGKCV
jgi:hypothetical protein